MKERADHNEHYFAAPILRSRVGGMTTHYLPVPDEICDALLSSGVRRVVGTFNGVPINRAIQHNRSGERFFMVSLSLLRDIRSAFGETVEVVVRPDPKPDEPELPVELVEVLAQDVGASERFYAMTPGKRRSLAHYVDSAKRPETRIKRALDLAEKLRTYTLSSDLQDAN